MESEHKKSKISLSKPEDIPTEQPEYNYDSISTNKYQSSQYYQQNQPQQNYSNTQYDQPRRLNSNIPRSINRLILLHRIIHHFKVVAINRITLF